MRPSDLILWLCDQVSHSSDPIDRGRSTAQTQTPSFQRADKSPVQLWHFKVWLRETTKPSFEWEKRVEPTWATSGPPPCQMKCRYVRRCVFSKTACANSISVESCYRSDLKVKRCRNWVLCRKTFAAGPLRWISMWAGVVCGHTVWAPAAVVAVRSNLSPRPVLLLDCWLSLISL